MPAIVFLFAGMARSYKCEVVLLGQGATASTTDQSGWPVASRWLSKRRAG